MLRHLLVSCSSSFFFLFQKFKDFASFIFHSSYSFSSFKFYVWISQNFNSSFFTSLPKKSSFAPENGCCVFHEWIFLLFNCYSQVLQVFKFSSTRKCCVVWFQFHSNTIINVFIDFFFKILRLLLYRKPALKEMTTRRFFIPILFFIFGGRRRKGQTLQLMLWRQHFLRFSCINLFPGWRLSREEHLADESRKSSHLLPLFINSLIHHSLINSSW